MASPLSPLLPRDELLARVPGLTIVALPKAALPLIAAKDPGKMYELALTSWDRLVAAGLNPVDPMAIGPYSARNDPRLLPWVERTIGCKVIIDILIEAAILPTGEQIATAAVAHIVPNVLHLADVEFIDPLKPIPPKLQRRKYTQYAGLGLLPNFILRLMSIARAIGAEKVTLTAASRGHISLFRRHGFEISDTIAGRANRNRKSSIPMDRLVG